MLSQHEKYISRCLELAAKGKGLVEPNPMVGCVIVHNEKIIAEGYHHQFGGPHAEIVAINKISDKSLIPQSTLYVSLEPCSHFGKTPPCADRIISEGFKKVVICNLDPNPLVAGNGIKKLIDAGIEVKSKVLEDEGFELNKKFFTFFIKKRPYILLKWAQSADGFIDSIRNENEKSAKISNFQSNILVHQLRSEYQAIMIGVNTANLDNPQLNVRLVKGKNPLRVILDPNLRINRMLDLFTDGIPTFIMNCKKNAQHNHVKFLKVEPHDFLKNVLDKLYELKNQSVMIEGGAFTHQQFIDAELYDEILVIQSKINLGQGISAYNFSELMKINQTIKYKVGDDTFIQIKKI